MTITMSFTVSTPSTSLLHSASYSTRGQKSSNLCTVSAILIHKNAIFQHLKGVPQLGFTSFCQWNGLKSSGIAISHYSSRMKKKGKCRGKGVYASLFGVGAPEALVIGVVALLVFGPKGLAEVARNLGKTLRAFQPTIRELQEVSREFKSTLEREIGLDDIDTPVQRNPNPNIPKPTPDVSDMGVESNGSPSETGEISTDRSAKVSESQFLGALAQLQKVQAEETVTEREEKEKEMEELEKAQLQLETNIPSQDTQAVDAPQEDASPPVMPPLQSPESNPLLQEAATPGPAPNLESET